MMANRLVVVVSVASAIYSGAGVSQTNLGTCFGECLSDHEVRSAVIDEVRKGCTPKCQKGFPRDPNPSLEKLKTCREKKSREADENLHPYAYFQCTGQLRMACVLQCDAQLQHLQDLDTATNKNCEAACKKEFSEPGTPETQLPGPNTPQGRTPPTDPSPKYMLRGGPLTLGWGSFGFGCANGGRWTQICVEGEGWTHCYPPHYVCY